MTDQPTTSTKAKRTPKAKVVPSLETITTTVIREAFSTTAAKRTGKVTFDLQPTDSREDIRKIVKRVQQIGYGRGYAGNYSVKVVDGHILGAPVNSKLPKTPLGQTKAPAATKHSSRRSDTPAKTPTKATTSKTKGSSTKAPAQRKGTAAKAAVKASLPAPVPHAVAGPVQSRQASPADLAHLAELRAKKPVTV